MVTSGGGQNLSPNKHIYPEHVTKEDKHIILNTRVQPSTLDTAGRARRTVHDTADVIIIQLYSRKRAGHTRKQAGDTRKRPWKIT